MLSTLHIENIAVIEQAEISFDSGFNVLTGETGAGKSIVIDAISAILGERASREMIRTGAQKAFVSAIFTGVPELPWFAENQVPYEPELGASREIFADGKNSCRVGGKPVTVSTLRRLGVQLIQIHGQNDSQQLFDEATHIGYLDLFAHDEALLESYRQAYDKVSAVRQEIRRLSMDESEKLRLVETLKFQIDELEQIEERLDTLHKLKRKYGGSVEDVLAFLEKAKRQLDEVEFATDRIEQLQKKLSGLQKTLLEQGTALTEARKAAAQRLQREISSELMQLDMPKIRFVCEFSEQTPQENGLDAVRFLMSANVGEALRPLSKVASGGELARIMLAMKNVLAAEDSVGTMIFDEVDAGVSGRAAQKVAYKLWTVAKGRQVLCVTHLPQIAAMADTEFTVEKRVENERTYTSVLRLDAAGRRQELARLIGGSMITETTLAGAAELLRLAGQTKRGEQI